MADDINPVYDAIGQSFAQDNESVGDSADALTLPIWADFGEDSTQPELQTRGDEAFVAARFPPGLSSSDDQPSQTHRPSQLATKPSNRVFHTSTRVSGKVDGRFSSTATKILKSWFEDHSDHPYPTPQEVHQLQGQTRLSVQQLRDWFANSRRRAKRQFQLHGTADSQTPPTHGSLPRDIPRRPDTPLPLEQMDPLQRWAHSPPDDEPALLSDISQALSHSPLSSGGRDISASWLGSLDGVSSPRSLSTSQSSAGSGSFSSFSQTSLGASFRPRAQARKAKKIRRRQQAQHSTSRGHSGLGNTYQCTFCPKSFASKYDWQRHEKSLHLPFEQWVCSPQGATQGPGDDAECAFCGQRKPDQLHLTGHNHDVCLDKPLIERTFYRKDHLVQHLHSVHRAPYSDVLMSAWKVVSQDIRSRCGFCDTWLSSWASRADHIARHFRDGMTMADWKGDWGFEPSVIEMLDNVMPPYLISFEQSTLLPFPASGRTARTRPSAYDLIKQEMAIEIQCHFETHGEFPSDDELCQAGVAIVRTADSIVETPHDPAASWLRDIFLPSQDDGALGQPPGRRDVCARDPKGGFFGECDLELQLRRYARMQICLGQDVADDKLQTEACRILRDAEGSSLYSSRYLLGFLTRLIWASTAWLAPLRARAAQDLESIAGAGAVDTRPQLQGEAIFPETSGPNNPAAIDFNSPGLQSSRASALHDDILCTTMDAGVYSTTPEINSASPLLTENDTGIPNNPDDIGSKMCFRMPSDHFISSGYSVPGNGPCQRTVASWSGSGSAYQRVARGLSLYVMKAMSPYNPQCHVPTDDELRYQARWLLYDDDDPWNQTPADNAKWLEEFKREIGLTVIEDTIGADALG